MSPAALSRPAGKSARKPDESAEQKILYQTYFKSIGTRTYAAQVKQAGNGNHFILLTEGRRDKETGEVRKTRLIVFSEDFPAFFKLLEETAKFVRQNPVPAKVAQRQAKRWQETRNREERPAPK